MANTGDAFNKSSFLDNFWLHALIIIPIEFGILHSTPLGPLISGWFENLWSVAGFEFTGHSATSQTLTEAIAETASQTTTTIPIAPPSSFATPIPAGKFCHMHGAELVCH